MKHIKHLFTALLLLCSVAANAHDFEVDGIYYNITDETNKTVEVTHRGSFSNDYSNEYTGDVTIPETVTYNSVTYIVTSIGNAAFYYCYGLTSIEIGDSVTSIGTYAFSDCSGLKSIEIPNSVTSIGEYAFKYCSGLTSVTIGNGVTSIGEYAFEYCSRLTAVHINDLAAWCRIDFSGSSSNPLSYAHNLYLNGEKVTDLVIPDGVTSIGDYAFEGCSGLTSIEIHNRVTSIGEWAFSSCSGLTSITVNRGNIFYDSREGCNAIIETATKTLIAGCKNTIIPNSVTSIKSRAFYGCTGLTSITIPNSVTSIGDEAFYACTGLASVTIGNRVTSIGDSAFFGCTGLKTVYNSSSLKIVAGNASNGCVAYYADRVINVSNGSVEGDFVFSIINGVKTLCGYIGNGGDVTLPENYNGKNYVIGDSAFYNYDSLASVTIGNSVASIGSSAFYDCDNLASVTIGNSVTSIGSSAFYSCNNLASVTIGNGVTSIGYKAFYYCTGLTSVTIPAGVTAIGYEAFYFCSGLTSVAIGNSVTSIGDFAFAGCTGLRTVYNCSSLNIVAGSTDNGFVAYYADKVINAPNGSVEGDFLFSIIYGVNTLCRYLGDGGDITLPENYNGKNYVIGSDAFKDNTTITSVTIPNSVTSIGVYAFRDCTGLTAVHINDLAAWCRIDFGSTHSSNPLSYAHNLYLNGEKVTDLVIPSDITEIKQYAFDGCSGLTSIEIPNSVTSIGYSAFEGCYGLTSIVIPNSVTSIGEYAFSACKNLKTVTNNSSLNIVLGSTDNGYVAYYADKIINAPNGSIEGDFVFGIIDGVNTLVEYIGNGGDVTLPENYNGENYVIGANAFKDNTAITGVTIPAGVTAIGDNAFHGCENLKTVYNYSTLYIVKGSTDNGCVAYYADEVINVDSSGNVVIGDYKFTSANGVNTLVEYLGDGGDITLPENYNGKNYVIGERAFDGCSGLTSVTIPNSVTSIGNDAFDGCTGLTSIEIPNSVTSIGDDAFYYCRGLTSVTIGNGVTSIGDYAFEYCSRLTAVHINDLAAWCRIDFSGPSSNPLSCACNLYLNGEKVTDLVIPSDITEIKQYAFGGCCGLTSIEIPNSVTSIGECAFSSCSGLTSIEIPNSVTSIGDNAFYGCSGLTSVTIPNSVTSIGNSAFRNCTGLTSVTIGNSVTSIGSNVFLGCTGLTSIEIPNSVTSIGDNAFYGCRRLTSVTIGNSVTSIGSNAFRGCSGLTSIEIPNIVTSIGDEAFRYCTGLTSVTIPNSVTSIGNSAFYGCENLKTVTNNSSLNIVLGSTDNGYVAYYADKVINADGSSNGVIGDYKFTSANGVNTLVEYLGNGKVITLDSWTSTNAGVNSSTSENTWTINAQTGDILIFDWRVSSESGYDKLIVIIDGSEILNKSGEGSDNYTYTFENAGTYTFVAKYTKDYSNSNGDDCATISNVKIASNGNASIALVLPESYNGENYVIGADVFQYNTAITSVTIPNSVTSIGGYAFYACKNLKTVYNCSSLNIVAGSTDNGYVAYYADEVVIPITVTGITLDKETATIIEGETETLVATIEPSNATDKTVTWASDNEEVATVENGVVTAVKAGTATITATAGGYSASCVVTVEAKAPITSLAELSNTAVYYICQPNHSKGKTSWAVATGGENLKSNKDLNIATDMNDTCQQFAILSIDGGVTRYLYHIATQMFVNLDGSLSTTPFDAINFIAGKYTNTFIAYFDNSHYVNVGGSQQMIIDKWNTPDGGNSCSIIPVGEFDSTNALKVLNESTTDFEITGITLDKSTATIIEGETTTLVATIEPSNATDKTVTWASDNEEVATVENGVVTAVKAGTATITATAGDYSASCVVTVEKKVIAVTGITLDKETATIIEGETETLTATVAPADATDKTVTWATSDASIATVDGGVVTAVKAGTATITATAGDCSASCVVTVEAKEEPEEPAGLKAGINYRIKHNTTGYYMTVVSTESSIQNAGGVQIRTLDNAELDQVFILESVVENSYKIKSINGYYLSSFASWGYNATVNNGDAAIHQFAEVEESVYTLSGYLGYIGSNNDDRGGKEHGAWIYSNHDPNAQNIYWVFEPLTAEENKALASLLQAAEAMNALERSIARGKEIVSSRDAVLSDDDKTSINTAVSTAENEKGNACGDVDEEIARLTALAEAIDNAVEDAIYIWSIDDISNSVCYTVSTENKGSWYSEELHLNSTRKFYIAHDIADTNQQFAFVKSADSGKYYLYSVGEEKFVAINGRHTTLTETPEMGIVFLNGTRSAAYPWVVALDTADGEKQISVSNGYDPGVITFWNDLSDSGNTVRLEKAAAFDATAALSLIKGYESESTGIEQMDGRVDAVYDLQGRKINGVSESGIYIVNGKKILVK